MMTARCATLFSLTENDIFQLNRNHQNRTPHYQPAALEVVEWAVLEVPAPLLVLYLLKESTLKERCLPEHPSPPKMRETQILPR